MNIIVTLILFILGVAVGFVFNGLLSFNTKQEENEKTVKRDCTGCKYLLDWSDGSVSCTHPYGQDCLKCDDRPLKTLFW